MLYVLAADAKRDVNVIIPRRNKKKEALICKLFRSGVKKKSMFNNSMRSMKVEYLKHIFKKHRILIREFFQRIEVIVSR